MRRRLPLRYRAILLVGLLFIVACGSSGHETNAGDEMDGYYVLTNGALGLDPVVEAAVPDSETDWTNLVRRYRDLGLAELSDADRKAILASATKAFLSTTRQLQWNVSIETDSGERSGWVIEEFTTSDDGLGMNLTSRKTEFDRFDMPWGADAVIDDSQPRHTLLFIRESGPDDVESEYWTSDDEQVWACSIESGLDFELFRLAYLGLFAGVVQGNVESSAVPDQVVLTATLPDGARVRYVLDRRSLWINEIGIEPATPGARMSKLRVVGRNNLTRLVTPGSESQCS